jgi:integrase
MPTTKLTKKSVDALQSDPKGDYFTWDTELKGFGVRVSALGRRVFVLKYRPAGRREARRLTLGPYGPLTVEEARQLARRRLGDIANGADPGRERRASKLTPTVRELKEAYFAEVKARSKPKTAVEYARMWDKHVDAALGTSKVVDVTVADVARLHRHMRETPYLANRVLAMLGAFFSFAARESIRQRHDNPAHGVERFTETAREFFLTPNQFRTLGEVLARAEREGLPAPPKIRELSRGMSRKRRAKLTGRKRGPYKRHAPPKLLPANPYAVVAIKLLMLTGCRESEILTLRWDAVDFERGYLRLRETKTGKSNRPLGRSAALVLHDLPRVQGNPYVLPGSLPRQHLKEIKRLWYAVRYAAGLDDVRLHDLRHSYASVSASAGESMLVLRTLLGHTRVATTERYTHVSDDPVRRAADRTSDDIAALIAPIDKPVTPLPIRAIA